MIETKYLYIIGKDSDYVTTSFSYGLDERSISIYDIDIDINNFKYISIDYTYDPFLSFNNYKYKNSNALTIYEFDVVYIDNDRNYIEVFLSKSIEDFDLRVYKRDIKINTIIN